ncbi:MAG: hypothetical protein ACP5OZ_04340 [Candidatus Woesearchaeota archaeon]
MADFLDLLFLEKFSSVFTFILVFVVTYGILSNLNFFKENKSLNAMVAFLFGFFTLLSTNLSTTIKILTPWLFFMLFIAFFILLIFRFLGTSEESIKGLLSKWGPVHTTTLGFLGFIMLIVFSQVYGSYFTSITTNATNTSDVAASALAAIFQPKLLGVAVLFLVAAFAAFWLTITPKK